MRPRGHQLPWLPRTCILFGVKLQLFLYRSVTENFLTSCPALVGLLDKREFRKAIDSSQAEYMEAHVITSRGCSVVYDNILLRYNDYKQIFLLNR